MSLPESVRAMLTRRSLPTLDERVVGVSIARKVERAFERLGAMAAVGTQVVCRCGGVVCREANKHYVETGLVGIDLPKFGEPRLEARLAGLWVN